jgi:trk system potassium uptake protein TrkA
MNVVIGGAGDAGGHLGRILRAEGHEITLIEKDPKTISTVGDIDALVIKGDVCDPKFLLEAGISHSDFYVGLVKEDSANLASCSLAASYGCGTLARIKSPLLTDEAISRRYSNIGVDVALCPSLITAHQISRVFAFPSKLRKMRKKGVGILHGVVEMMSKSRGRRLFEIKMPKGAKIVSIFRGIQQILPTESLILQEEDELFILVEERVKVENVKRALGIEMKPYAEVKDVFIAGATNMGLTLSEKLLESNISVVIMDSSEERTNKAAEMLPKATIIHSDPMGHGVLKNEEMSRFDILMALGFGMERNILISVLAKQFGVPNARALLDRIYLKTMVEKTLIDDVVVPNLLLVKTIFNMIRQGSSLGTQPLKSDEIIAKDIKVTNKLRCANKSVGEFNPASTILLIAGILKGKDFIVPNEETMIKEGDRIYILYRESSEQSVEKWLLG